MPTLNAISPDKMARLLGIRTGPAIIDVRIDAADLIPGSLIRPADRARDWAHAFKGDHAIVVCADGKERSSGIAAFLRTEGALAEILEGGFEAWVARGFPTIPAAKLPTRDPAGRTIWVTRARPKVDRIACPWLVRRFIDPVAVFLFVSPADVLGVAAEFGATPFDVEGAELSDQEGRCSFDAMLDAFGLADSETLQRMAAIVRAADSGTPEAVPQAAGVLALSLGLSRMHSDDLAQLEDGMILYDALYRWCRDAVEETHDVVSHAPRARRS